MLNPISYPQGRCFLDRVPNIAVTAGNRVMFTLSTARFGGIVPLFVGRYQPGFEGKINIDISDIVANHLKTTLPTGTNDHQQTGFETRFIFKVDEEEDGGELVGNFIVLNASPGTDEPVEDWCASHFLTCQPIEKPTNYESPEWLTYYDYVGDWIVVGRFYPKEGGLVDMIVKWDEKPGCWSVNVNYARLIPQVARLPFQLKGFYDIILFDGSMNELCRQRYLYDERTAKEKYYLLANSLGGFDTLICQGENVLQPELEHNIGRFAKLYKALDDSDDMRQWQQNIGSMPYRWRNWIYDLMANKQCAAKYDPKTETCHPIVLTSSENGMGDNGQLAGASFSYIMADNRDMIEEEERYLSQSAADTAADFDDLTTEAVATITGGVSEPIVVMSEKVFVSFAETEHQEEVTYYINGEDAGIFTTGTDKSPVVIDLPFGASIFFKTDGETDTFVLNWYDGWKEVEAYSFIWGTTVCAEQPEPPVHYTFGWSEQVCAVNAEPYSFAWTENRCVLDAGGWEFRWKEERCVTEYIYKLVWEEMEEQDDETEQMNN